MEHSALWVGWTDCGEFLIRDGNYANSREVGCISVYRPMARPLTPHFLWLRWQKKHWWNVAPFNVRWAKEYTANQVDAFWFPDRDSAMDAAIRFGCTGEVPEDKMTKQEQLREEVMQRMAINDVIGNV